MQKDKLVFDLIRKELERQRRGIELIASENFTSFDVMQSMGNVMTNKYAEGYPGRRYYGGCEVVDESEQLAIDRLKTIFNCEYANVQPHSERRQMLPFYCRFYNLAIKYWDST